MNCVEGIERQLRTLHNFARHGADAFRMLAVGLGKLSCKGLSAEEWLRIRQHNLG